MKILHVGLAAGLFLIGTVGAVRADDGLRRYQQALRDQGFYYGPIDGSPGDETTQAVRRYQIRSGLSVTGTLDDDTRRSIDRNAEAAQPTPPPLATPTPVRRATTPLPTPVFTPTPRPVPRRDDPQDDRRPTPPPRDDALDGRQRYAPSVALSNYLGGTPYEFAPPPVQADVVRRAQRALSRSGFYDGEPDGRPSRELAEAVSNFQEVRRLRRSGRLDADTLAALRLSPDRRNGPPRRDPSDDERRNDRRVYNGRVVD